MASEPAAETMESAPPAAETMATEPAAETMESAPPAAETMATEPAAETMESAPPAAETMATEPAAETMASEPSTRGVSFGSVQIRVFTNSSPDDVRPIPRTTSPNRLARQPTIPHPDNPGGVVNGRQVGPSASIRLNLSPAAEARRMERQARRERLRANDTEGADERPMKKARRERIRANDTEGADERPMKKARRERIRANDTEGADERPMKKARRERINDTEGMKGQ